MKVNFKGYHNYPILKIKIYKINPDEVLNVDFDKGAAKIPEVKVGVWKKYLPTWLTPSSWFGTWQI